LGFPNGVSGAELSRRAISQAARFGVELLSPQEVVDIALQDNYKIIHLKDGTVINARSLIITTGVDYRPLEATDIEKFTGAGVYYGASTTEAHACKDQPVYIVGGGNSAGQSAMYLSNHAKRVYIVIRKKHLSATMSQYLIDQINATENIEVVPETIVGQVLGDEKLSEICLENIMTHSRKQVPASALFIFIGARPATQWIQLDIIKDTKGFIETGRDLLKYEAFKKSWKLKREPYLLETCSPGIFAAGDVRAGAMNRVASAVGEGAMAVKFVHQYLAEN
jgi:thioredoxin reductase (NADPH)